MEQQCFFTLHQPRARWTYGRDRGHRNRRPLFPPPHGGTKGGRRMRRRAFTSAVRPGDKACLCRGAHKARSCRDLPPGQCVPDPRARMVNFSPSHVPPLGPFRPGNSWFPISLFIFKFKPTNGEGGASPSAELVIDHVIPVFGDFSISIALSKRNTIDLRNPSSPLTRNQPRTGTRLSPPFEQHHPLFSH